MTHFVKCLLWGVFSSLALLLIASCNAFEECQEGETTSVVEPLSNFSRLTALDALRLQEMTHIGNSFFSDCNRLTSIDPSPLSDVTSMEIDPSPLREMTPIRNDSLSNCTRVPSVDPSLLSDVTSIEYVFDVGEVD